MQSTQIKNKGGIFSTGQPKIRIFSKELPIKLVAINASLYQRSTQGSTPYGENGVDHN